MTKIVVRFPRDRDYSGALSVLDHRGEVLAGPFPVSGRANSAAAAKHGNPNRLGTLPYGDTPVGTYRVGPILPSGDGTAYGTDSFGPHGVLVMEATGGDAALAEAAGRFRLLIQGGAPGPRGELRATNGCLRLSNTHQKALVDVLRSYDKVLCDCALDDVPPEAQTRIADLPYEEGDPPLQSAPVPQFATRPDRAQTRRDFLRVAGIAAGAFAFGGTFFVAPSASAQDMAGGEYDPGNVNVFLPSETKTPEAPVDIVVPPDLPPAEGGDVDWNNVGNLEGPTDLEPHLIDPLEDPPITVDNSVTNNNGDTINNNGDTINNNGNTIINNFPAPEDTGLVVGSGVDLGQIDPDELDTLDIPDPVLRASITLKLKPFVGLKGKDAVKQYRVQKHNNALPKLTPAEARALDASIRQLVVPKVAVSYNKASPGKNFDQIPKQAQAVLIVFALEYGPDLATRAPAFWGFMVKQDWKGAINLLSKTKDVPGGKRDREIALLSALAATK